MRKTNDHLRPDQRQLRDAAHWVAGNLVAAEQLGGGGWSVIWKGPEHTCARAPATVYTEVAKKDTLIPRLVASMAEALQPPACFSLHSLKAMAGKWDVTSSDGKPATQEQIEQAALIALFKYRQISDYAAAHLEQWERPEDLPLFRLDKLKDRGNHLEHHRAAHQAGTVTACSLFQSTGDQFAIPQELFANAVAEESHHE